MGADERDLQLAHEHVRVVARIADQRQALVVARDVAVALEQLRRVVAPVQVRRADRPAAVERLEVGARGAHVVQAREVRVRAQRRAVRGQVVRDVLSEERPAGLGLRVALAIAAVAEPSGRADPVQQRLVGDQRGQVEHPPVAPADLDRRVDPLGSQAVSRRHRLAH